MAWAGTLSLSWWELREFLHHLRQDDSSSLYRSLHPDDHMWSRVDTQLLAEIATHTSASRWLDAAGRLESVPDDWAPGRYGPVDTSAADRAVAAEAAALDRAERAAADLRA